MRAVLNLRMTLRPDLVWYATATPVRIEVRAAVLIVEPPIVNADDFVSQPAPTDHVIPLRVLADGTTVPMMTPTQIPFDPSIASTPWLVDDSVYSVAPIWLLPVASALGGPIVAAANPSTANFVWRTATAVLPIVIGAFVGDRLQTHLVEPSEVSSWCYDQLACETVYKGQAHPNDGDLHCVQDLESNPEWKQCNQRFGNLLLSEHDLVEEAKRERRGGGSGGGGNNGGNGGNTAGGGTSSMSKAEWRRRAFQQCFPGGGPASNSILLDEGRGVNTHEAKKAFNDRFGGSPCCSVDGIFDCVH